LTFPAGPRGAISSTGSLCVQGFIDAVLNGDFSTQWGALMGLSFVSELGNASWDRDAGRVQGFAFTVEGPAIPPLRFDARPVTARPEDTHCHILGSPSGGRLAARFDELDLSCWEGIDNPLGPGDLTSFGWQLPSDELSSHAFDFCVSDIRPILE
jgi:hypothetical protein